MSEKRIYGIDLGTTYSCIAVLNEAGRPEILTNLEGEMTTPSVVYFEDETNITAGRSAKNSSKLYPDRTVSLIKREMGKPGYVFPMDGRDYKPEEISAYILKKIVKDASDQFGGDPITDVVITCPAYFGISQRMATEAAGSIAGLTVHRVVNEPTAAAFFYSSGHLEDQIVLVYDLGGGTFDITLIEVKDGGVQVIVTDGNFDLGGKDWDDALINYLAEQFMQANPDAGDPRDDAEVLQTMTIEAEEIKRGLTSRDKIAASVSHNGARSRIEVTREQFEQMTSELLERTMELTSRCIQKGAEKGFNTIDRMLLVGGSSFMPQVAARIEEAFADIPFEMFEPNLAVAKGAALVGAKILAGELIRDLLPVGTLGEGEDLGAVPEPLLEKASEKAAESGELRLGSKELLKLAKFTFGDVCSKSFGVVQTDVDMTESVVFLIHANTKVPQDVQQRFGTHSANQRSVHLKVMEQAGQEESSDVADNILVTDGELTGLPPGLPSGSPIDVTFQLAADGQMDVFALEPGSGKELHIQVKLEGVMTAAEIEESKGLMLQMNVS